MTTASFETKFCIGDEIFKRDNVISWANGAANFPKLYKISLIDIRVEAVSNKHSKNIGYRATGGEYIAEEFAIAKGDAKATAIQHLSARLSSVAAHLMEEMP